MNAAEATREIYWNIDASWLMYLLAVPTVIIAAYGFYRRYRRWRQGQPEVRWDRPRQRFGLLLRHAIAQGRTLGSPFAGAMHLMVYTGFIILTVATIVVMLDADFGTGIMRGSFYLWFQSLVVDVFGGLLMVGLLVAAARRWTNRSKQLVLTAESNWILILIFSIAATGFLVEGLRIAATADPWGHWSPVGYLVASATGGLADAGNLEIAHAVWWWLHLALVFGFIAWAPYTKLAHIVTGPLNIFTANLDGYSRSLKKIDFD
ncbi:MAG: (Fe-S)-binding protein, partial [bacterium]|nr:(Fe-S)-binding protein [bacterium]